MCALMYVWILGRERESKRLEASQQLPSVDYIPPFNSKLCAIRALEIQKVIILVRAIFHAMTDLSILKVFGLTVRLRYTVNRRTI